MRNRIIISLLALLLLAGASASIVAAGASAGSNKQANSGTQRRPSVSGVVQATAAQASSAPSAPDPLGALRGDAGINNVVFGPDRRANLVTTSLQNETSIALDPANHNVINCSANDYRTGPPRAGWYHSSDSGQTWVDGVFTQTSTSNSGDPAMAFGPNGHAYYTYIAFNGEFVAGGGIGFSRSTDGGATWSSNIVVDYSNSTSLFNDKEFMTVDNNPSSPYYGRIYIAWVKYDQANNSPLFVTHSSDDGLTWSVPVEASGGVSHNQNQGAWPRVAPNGDLFVAFINYNTGNADQQMMVVRSTDGGTTFTPPLVAVPVVHSIPDGGFDDSNYRTNSFPAFAVDPGNGYLYMTWAEYVNSDANILFTRSTDSGVTWSASVRIDDAPNGQQFFPAMSASADGRISVVWNDSRNQANSSLFNAYFTSSPDHGVTWDTPNIRVSSQTSNAGSSTFIGDYNGIDSADDAIYPCWTDIRTGNQDVWVAKGVPDVATPTPSPVPTTATPTLTATPLQTDTPTPTQTAVPPTDTPLPSATATNCANPFLDINGNVFYNAIMYLYCRSVVNGLDATHYGPAGTSTRAQFAKVVVLGFGIADYTPAMPDFTDVPANYFAYAYIEAGYHAGILSGFDAATCAVIGAQNPCYGPNRPITRAQLTKLVVAAGGFAPFTPTSPTFTDVGTNNVFYASIETAHHYGIINGYPDNTFRPNNNIRRDEMAQIVYKGVTVP